MKNIYHSRFIVFTKFKLNDIKNKSRNGGLQMKREKETMRTKREFNERVRQLISIGYSKCGEYQNTDRYCKRDTVITLVRGWKMAS